MPRYEVDVKLELSGIKTYMIDAPSQRAAEWMAKFQALNDAEFKENKNLLKYATVMQITKEKENGS
jgi:hypothetical protein